MKTRTSGLTVIEILVVVSIIALLVGLLLPAVHKVQIMAKETKQKAQFTSIELGLAAFKSDYGDYPPSSWSNPALPGSPQDYCGAQKLAEALLGWDLLGFHPDSKWQASGLGLNAQGQPVLNTVYAAPDSLDRRKGRYIELEHANAFRLGDSAPGTRDGLFPDTSNPASGNQALAARTYVLCDVFTVNDRKVLMNSSTVALPGVAAQMTSPGTPILYYKANTASKVHVDAQVDPINRIYNVRDNWPLVSLGRLADAFNPLVQRRHHPLEDANFFYEYIRDLRVQARPWPHRPDSYLLISAGADGLYGTNDDIRNFGQ